MRTCPQCANQYSDDTLRFCLQDGTRLVAVSAAETPTALLSEEEATRVRASAGAGPGGWRPSEVTRVQSFEQPAPRQSSGLGVVLATVGVLAIVGAGGIIALLIWQNSGGPVISNIKPNTNIGLNAPTNNAVPNSNISTPQSNAFSGTPASSATPPEQTSDTSTTDNSQIEKEVSRQLYSWKTAMESHDLSSYMSHYAPTVNYYARGAVSSSTVRADKSRAFDTYSSMRVSITNLDVRLFGIGRDSATIAFDKEWTFTGSGTSAGKVRSQFDLKLIDGKWLIAGEKDLKVYSR